MKLVAVSCVLPLLVSFVFSETETPTAESECGIPNFRDVGGSVSKRVNGGVESKANDWPWQVLLLCNVTSTKTSICGGTLISNQWVLTAAHCLDKRGYDYSYRDCSVHLGKHYLNIGSHKIYIDGHRLKPWGLDETEEAFKIAYKIVHQEYRESNSTLGYDIALLKLEQDVTFTPAIKPICMPFGLPALDENSTCYTAGWGRYNNQVITSQLRHIKMPIKKHTDCQFTAKAGSPLICAGEIGRMENVCGADSGGPLACLESDGRWTVHGVLSQTDDKCLRLAAYSKVAAFENWIKLIMSKGSDLCDPKPGDDYICN